MAIKKLTNGRWEASYRDPSGRERVKHHPTRSAADRWLTSVKNELNRGDYVDPRLGRSLFSRWATEWLDTAAHLKPKTRVDYETMLRVHVLPAFGERTVGSIQQGDVRRFIAAKVSSGAAPGTVRGARKILRLVLATAQAEGAIRARRGISPTLPRTRSVSCGCRCFVTRTSIWSSGKLFVTEDTNSVLALTWT